MNNSFGGVKKNECFIISSSGTSPKLKFRYWNTGLYFNTAYYGHSHWCSCGNTVVYKKMNK